MEQNEFEVVLALLRNKELHVRGLSKVINKPHASISRLMKDLLKRNVVDFKLEGKNKVFKLKKSIECLNFIYMAEHFKLLKLFDKYPHISVIAEMIASKTNEELIIIFGSFAKFSANRNSDIDIFVETMDRKVKTELENINSRISVKIGEFNQNNLLVKEIMKDHVILKGVEKYYEKIKIFD